MASRPISRPRTAKNTVEAANPLISTAKRARDSQRHEEMGTARRTSARSETRSLITRATPGASSASYGSGRMSMPPRATPVRDTRSFARAPSATRMATPTPSAISIPFLRDVTPAPSFSIPRARSMQSNDEGIADEAGPSTGKRGQTAPNVSKQARSSSRSLPEPSHNKTPRGSKPAAPPSAYSLFAKDRRPIVERDAATPTGPRFDVNKAVRQAWNALPREERMPYELEHDRRRSEYETAMGVWQETFGVTSSALSSANGSSKRPRRSSSHKPSLPENAYQLFRKAHESALQTASVPGAGAIATVWHGLTDSERSKYREEATFLRDDYEKQLAQWRVEFPVEAAEDAADTARGTKRDKRQTISDDEAEYCSQVAEYGKSLSGLRLDVNATSMSDLSEKTFDKGRASEKTFELDRKLREQRRERNRIRQRMRKMQVRTEEDLEQLERRSTVEKPQEGQTASATPPAGYADEGEESVTNVEGATIETDGEDAVQSDAESIGAASTSTRHTLREKQFSVRTRIVNGQIVLDESSLQQSQNDGAGISGPSTEFVDVNESDRFVNSATHAKRRGRNDRWQPAETEYFLRAVSMWGTDFEMISRMFPLRDRRQIRAKWRSMERTDSHSLDLAFKTRVPVDLAAYGLIAGVDLSGEAPQINVDLSSRIAVKKADEDEADEGASRSLLSQQTDNDALALKEVEYYENGMEIVEEGDDLDPSAQTRPGDKLRQRRVANVDVSSMPPPQLASIRKSGDKDSGIPSRRGRSSSIASTSTNAPGSAHGASSAAASDRQRRQRKAMDDDRKGRELARRRPPATGEEEVIE